MKNPSLLRAHQLGGSTFALRGAFTALLAALSCVCLVRLQASNTPPNVLILVSDDQGWGDVGYHGSEISTPNIDQLAKEGLEMNRWYSNPWCGPTRASMLTGHIAARHGIFSGGGNLTHDEQLLNEAFKDAGYTTMTAGKWHLGCRTRADFPINRGFDHTYGSLMAGPDYFTHSRGEQKDWARDGKTVIENGYMTDLFGNEISRLIRERDKSKPFFSYVAFTAPHTPLPMRIRITRSMQTNLRPLGQGPAVLAEGAVLVEEDRADPAVLLLRAMPMGLSFTCTKPFPRPSFD